ncbi:helix-turn-helix transcriptional regulator [Microlunatus soli]|uniref:HTH domain-containing protein n=1 Tax=Microlunatus soli TaxID=630515 RepID=A0A1H1RNW1_9ACTN|nr:WYL domain-containing protein [Microlunatus soli]SDS37487.1 HTH domain-containing protein [Microlunatus soli]
MNRTDRLYAVTEELRRLGHRGATSSRLARTFEVSERTIKRDIDALQQSGLPIWAQAGPGGGYVLDDSASLPPVNFTPRQAVALAIASAALPVRSPFAVDAAAARQKIWDTLGETAAQRARALAARVWIDHGDTAESESTSGTGDHARAEQRAATEVVPVARRYLSVSAAVEESLATARVLAIRYRDARGEVTSRRVEPILLAHTRAQWYLVCWDRLRDAVRWFSLHRMIRADLTAERYQPRDVDVVGTPPSQARPVD